MSKSYCVYFIIDGTGRLVKVGYTCDLDGRLATLQTGSAIKLQVRRTFACRSEHHAMDLEQSLHALFKKRGAHFRDEWFDYPKVNAIFKKYRKAVEKMRWLEQKQKEARLTREIDLEMLAAAE